MNKKPPLVYKRSCDHRFIAVVRMPGGKAIRRGTGCRDRDAAMIFANLLQRHISLNALAGNLLPPPANLAKAA